MNLSTIICRSPFLWNQSSLESQRPVLYVCIIATFTHSLFWLQLLFFSSIRQKSMQWIYAYLATDILLLVRFFFLFIVHTVSTDCYPSQFWYTFVMYFEAIIDNYLNILEVYILLALNICRHVQIAQNRNVYQTNVRWLTMSHLAIYIIPLIILVIQIPFGWASFRVDEGGVFDIAYTNTYAEVFNVIIAFFLPISLNVIIIYKSVHYIRLTSHLHKNRHQVSARDKYHRSLVIQFLVFYIIWLLLWAPNVIIYQFTSGRDLAVFIGQLLNFIEITIDPLIIAGLDIRFYQVWKKLWIRVKNRTMRELRVDHRRIAPTIVRTVQQTVHHQYPH
ncbi:unnamed protein product [Adineta ricciae]|uniref:G-protein coupled receptors family 1 profile domain-containing protein n=2 Tax=Adineta ricciae TaxID=249248 RepID=A0A814HMG0_ADIRI|nr:unnamed protein product [Adineta ricciae]